MNELAAASGSPFSIILDHPFTMMLILIGSIITYAGMLRSSVVLFIAPALFLTVVIFASLPIQWLMRSIGGVAELTPFWVEMARSLAVCLAASPLVMFVVVSEPEGAGKCQ